jgi:hypothetical protein
MLPSAIRFAHQMRHSILIPSGTADPCSLPVSH